MKLCRDLYFLKQNHGVSRTSPLHVSLSVNEKNHYQGYVPEFNLKNYCTGLENNIYCHSFYEEETCNSKVVSASVHRPQSRLCVVHCQCKGKGKTFFKQRKCLGYHPERSGGRECLFLEGWLLFVNALGGHGLDPYRLHPCPCCTSSVQQLTSVSVCGLWSGFCGPQRRTLNDCLPLLSKLVCWIHSISFTLPAEQGEDWLLPALRGLKACAGTCLLPS